MLTTTQLESEDQLEEGLKSAEDPAYFIDNYCKIYDSVTKLWIRFELWAFQVQVIDDLQTHKLVIILKARQLGLTWVLLCYALWLMLFRPSATILLFSRREDEAKELLKRLVGIYDRLPDYLKVKEILRDNTSIWELSNGSVAHCFPTTAGDSYSASFVLADEFDLVENQDDLITAVKPTIDAGGQFVLLSRANKKLPESSFKNVYRAAVEKKNNWLPIFLPWSVRPDRTTTWYEDIKADSISRTSSLDSVAEQYPATDVEALAPNTLDKRIPPRWLEQCYVKKEAIDVSHLVRNHIKPPTIPGIQVYSTPKVGRLYIVGADPAEGNPSSDDSAATVIDSWNGEEVCYISGKFDTTTFGQYLWDLSRWYRRAGVLIERNNHGHAVINAYLTAGGPPKTLIKGHDKKVGWVESKLSKAMLYDYGSEVFRDEDTIIHTFSTYVQLGSIEGNTNRAPEGQHDDLAVSYVLALNGRLRYRPIPSSHTSEPAALSSGYRIPGYDERDGLEHVYGPSN